jgi:hypothetical protein
MARDPGLRRLLCVAWPSALHPEGVSMATRAVAFFEGQSKRCKAIEGVHQRRTAFKEGESERRMGQGPPPPSRALCNTKSAHFSDEANSLTERSS